MAKQQTSATAAASKTNTRKRTVKVESAGQAHINATFNNIIISMTNAQVRLYHGVVPVKWVSGGLKKIHLTLPKWQHKIAQKSHLITACVK